MKPKVALIFAGGTIDMIQDRKTGFLHPAKNTFSMRYKYLYQPEFR